MLKKSLAFALGLLVTLVVFAASTQLRPNHPDTYTVRKGDTLWAISARFLNKPWLWPEIWRANPQVHNPHLIYPGDVLNMSYAGGDGGSAYLGLQPRVRATPLGDAIPAVPLNAIKPFLKDLRVVDGDTLKNSPYVVAVEENHMLATPGHFLYVRGLKAQPGEDFTVVRPTHIYRQFGSGDDSDRVGHLLDNNVGMVNGPWKEMTRGDGHWGKGDPIGFEVQVIGTAKYLRGDDPATLLLDDATMEVRAGDRIMPVDSQPYDSSFYPHTPSSLPKDLKILAFADALHAAGRMQVVSLSAGSAEGIDNGSTFAIFRPGERVQDNVISAHSDTTFGHKVQLPAEYVGHVMVFRTFDHVSYGLIMDGIRPVNLGDTLRKPE